MARADRNGKRKSRASFQTRVPDLGYYFIITDTEETETNYMYGLRDSLPKELQGRIVIKVSKAKTRNWLKHARIKPRWSPSMGNHGLYSIEIGS